MGQDPVRLNIINSYIGVACASIFFFIIQHNCTFNNEYIPIKGNNDL